MPKVTIEVPDGFEEAVKALEETLKRAQTGVEGAKAGDIAAFDAAWEAVNEGVEETERQMKRRLLRALDIDAARIRIEGILYARVGRYASTCKTRSGEVEVERCLYRRVGERNGGTVDAVSLRWGAWPMDGCRRLRRPWRICLDGAPPGRQRGPRRRCTDCRIAARPSSGSATQWVGSTARGALESKPRLRKNWRCPKARPASA